MRFPVPILAQIFKTRKIRFVSSAILGVAARPGRLGRRGPYAVTQ